jgi:hypothetical protein
MSSERKTPEQILQQCIKELCEIAEPEEAQKWFSRWIRSVGTEVEFTSKEAELRESLAALGPNEPKNKDILIGREQFAIYSVGTSAVQQHGDTQWIDEGNRKVCKTVLYALSMKGPLDEGHV